MRPRRRSWRHRSGTGRRANPGPGAGGTTSGGSISPIRPARPEPGQAGHREHEGVGLARVEPPQPRVDVAVERMELEVGPLRPEERGPARAVRSDAGALRQVLQRLPRLATDERITGILAPGKCRDREAGILGRGDVLRAVDREVDLPADGAPSPARRRTRPRPTRCRAVAGRRRSGSSRAPRRRRGPGARLRSCRTG